MNVQKIAVIGWDGATFDVIFPLIRKGALPNLQRLISNGAWGKLVSTLHPLTPPAWASFMTGMNPGKHGVFDFIGMEKGGQFRVINGKAIKAKTLWARLSEAGRRVAVINVPMTYPPEPVNGFLIAGMDAPRWDYAFTYPPELAEELYKYFGTYRVGVPPRGWILTPVKHFTPHYIKQLCELVYLRSRVTCYLLEHYPIDFLMVVFTATDRAQHALGHLMANGVSPDDGIGQVYKACDDALGSILERLDEDWIVFLMSDHGACPYNRVFELSTWLVKQGWLHLRPEHQLQKLIRSISLVYYPLSKLLGGVGLKKTTLERFFEQIIWEKTRAFALGAFGSIYINTTERFPKGVVKLKGEYQAICEQITEELLSIRDPDTGETVVQAVYRADEIYHGPYVSLAPDLLIETASNYFVRNNLDHCEGQIIYPAGRYQGRSLMHTGKHSLEGILIAIGTPFAPGGNRHAYIMDVAPTILYLSGLPIPSEMDGKPLLDWLTPDYRQSHPVQWCVSRSLDESKLDNSFYNQQEDEIIEARLRDLGYIG